MCVGVSSSLDFTQRNLIPHQYCWCNKKDLNFSALTPTFRFYKKGVLTKKKKRYAFINLLFKKPNQTNYKKYLLTYCWNICSSQRCQTLNTFTFFIKYFIAVIFFHAGITCSTSKCAKTSQHLQKKSPKQ